MALAAGKRRWSRGCGDRPALTHVYGYPDYWPAGPWVVPLFWLIVMLLAFALH
jgi:hypothetical protein